MTANSQRMSEEKEVDHTGKIDNGSRRTHHLTRSIPQGSENIVGCQLARARNARVVPAKGVQLVRIGSRDQRFAKLRGHFRGPAVQIERRFMKMTELDRVEAINHIQKPFTD